MALLGQEYIDGSSNAVDTWITLYTNSSGADVTVVLTIGNAANTTMKVAVAYDAGGNAAGSPADAEVFCPPFTQDAYVPPTMVSPVVVGDGDALLVKADTIGAVFNAWGA